MRKLFSIIAVTLTASILTTSASAADTFGGAQVADSGSGMKVVIVEKAAQNAIIAKSDLTMDSNSESGGSSGNNGTTEEALFDKKIKNAFLNFFGNKENAIANTEVINKLGTARGVSRTLLPNSQNGTAFTVETFEQMLLTESGGELSENPSLNEYFGFVASNTFRETSSILESDYGNPGEANTQSSSYWKILKFTPGFISGSLLGNNNNELNSIVNSEGDINSTILNKLDGRYIVDGTTTEFCYGNLFENSKDGLLEDTFILISKMLQGTSVDSFTQLSRNRDSLDGISNYLKEQWISPANEFAKNYVGEQGEIKIYTSGKDEGLMYIVGGSGREVAVQSVCVNEINEKITKLKDAQKALEEFDAEAYAQQISGMLEAHGYQKHNDPNHRCGPGCPPEDTTGYIEGKIQERINELKANIDAAIKELEEKKREWSPFSTCERTKSERTKHDLLPEEQQKFDKQQDLNNRKNDYSTEYNKWLIEHNEWKRKKEAYDRYQKLTPAEKNKETTIPEHPGVEPTEPTKPSDYGEVYFDIGNIVNSVNQGQANSVFTESYIRYKNAVNILDGPGGVSLSYDGNKASSYEESNGSMEESSVQINTVSQLEELAWYYYVELGQVGYPSTEEVESVEKSIETRREAGLIDYTYEDFVSFENWLSEKGLFFYKEQGGPNYGYTLGPNGNKGKNLSLLITMYKILSSPGKEEKIEYYNKLGYTLNDNERLDDCQKMDEYFYYIKDYLNGSYGDSRAINGAHSMSTQKCAIKFLDELGILGGNNLSQDQWLSATYYTDVSVVDYANNKQYHSGNFQRYEWYVLYNPGKGANRNDSNTKVVYHNTTTAKTCPFTPVESGTYWVECYQSSKSSYGEHLYYNIRNFLVDETTQMVLFSTMDFRRQEKIAEKLIPEKIALRCNENGVYVSKGQNIKWRADEGQIILDSFTTEKVPDNVFNKYGG